MSVVVRSNSNTESSPKHSYPKDKIKVVLLENIHPEGVKALQTEGFAVTSLTQALSGESLIDAIKDAHIVGVRSKTKLTKEVLEQCKKLKGVGCFCIGTDQCDLEAAALKGVPIFNSPYSNSRSVAELVISHVISLSRQVPNHTLDMHNGVWNKTAKNCCEIRGKTLGIVGYGHIGTQLGVMAEALQMKVIFYDILDIMPLGGASPVNTLEELLDRSDYVTLHVPDTPVTRQMIGAKQISLMKKGSFLLNLSRGTVVDLYAARDALESGHLSGIAIDVYPVEPEENGILSKSPKVDIPLIGKRNVILTPHIGGSTEEAQRAIGVEVSSKLIKFMNLGLTEGAVNFPNITPVPFQTNHHRVLHIHFNRQGVLREINNILGDIGNIEAQQLRTNDQIGYLVVDVQKEISAEIKKVLQNCPHTIGTRVLF